MENTWVWAKLMPMHESSCNGDPSFFVVSLFVVSVVVLWLSSLIDAHTHRHVSCARWVTSPTSPVTSSPISSSLLSSCSSCCLKPSTSLMSWITSPRTSAEELRPLAEKNSSTGYEPFDHFITEAYDEYTQESLTEQRFPEDFGYDDITIGQLMRAEDEPITLKERIVVLSVVVNEEQGNTLFAVTWVTSTVEKFRGKTLKANRLETLLDRQRRQILADCQAEIRKHESQTDYDRRI